MKRDEDDKNGTQGLAVLSRRDAQGTLHTHTEKVAAFLGERGYL